MSRHKRRLLRANSIINKGQIGVSISLVILTVCIIAYFLSLDKEVKNIDNTNSSKLLAAAKNCDLSTVEFLVKNAVNIYDSGIGERALHKAADLGCLEIVKFLIEEGVNINAATTPSVWTALHYAADGGHLEVVKFLLEEGANPHIIADDGRSPRDMVRYSNRFYEEIRSLLYKAEKRYKSKQ